MITGTTIAQIITLILTPIISRMYVAEDFAILAIVLSINAVIGALACGRYENAIILPFEKEKAFHLLVLCYILLLSTCIITFLVILFCPSIIENFVHTSFSPIWFSIPVFTFVSSSYTIFCSWVNREKNYKSIAYSKIIQNTVGNGSSVLMGISHWGGAGLIISTLIGALLSIAKPIYTII